MRGSRICRICGSCPPGIIPAHAGLTDESQVTGTASRDHPRACGAHFGLPTAIEEPLGSSPRMRGSLVEVYEKSIRPGIIPAHAGLTVLQEACEGGRGDHPRACGAHNTRTAGACAGTGSSPRMRGSRLCREERGCWLRIIPAHAGLTSASAIRIACLWDHPRACGAHIPPNSAASFQQGSSPRMRGSLPSARIDFPADGIIPAHAGLTEVIKMKLIHGRDHPRACGAHPIGYRPERPRWGSSPRMRGSPVDAARLRPIAGIIPAHAGLTSGGSGICSYRRDHPRACGAHFQYNVFFGIL